MRSSRVVRACDCKMPKLQQSWVRSQLPLTQWNLKGGRDEAVLKILKNPKKSPFKNINPKYILNPKQGTVKTYNDVNTPVIRARMIIPDVFGAFLASKNLSFSSST
jgi:hypothetical protein